MRRAFVVLASAVALIATAPGAGGETDALSGAFVFSCSGCPQNKVGASLFVVNADGRGLRELVRSSATQPHPAPYEPRWSPSGATVAFSSGFQQIWAVDLTSGKARRLTTTADNVTPAWSPDGRTLVFSHGGALYTMPARGGHLRLLEPKPGQLSFVNPDWSPDGRRIVFDRSGATLYVARADGSGRRRLAPGFEARYARWSPDGQSIAFLALRDPGWRLMVARSDGSHVRLVANRNDIDPNVNPAWSPDGRRLAFVITRTFDEENSLDGHVIVTVRLDGSGTRAVAIPQLPVDVYSEFYGIDWKR